VLTLGQVSQQLKLYGGLLLAQERGVGLADPMGSELKQVTAQRREKKPETSLINFHSPDKGL